MDTVLGPDGQRVDKNHAFWNSTYRARVTRMSNGRIEVCATQIRHQLEAGMIHRRNANIPATPNRDKSIAVAARRARRMVRNLVCENQFDHLLTLTYRECVDDIERVKRDWKRFVRFVRVKYPDWAYVVVPEIQSRGAWHLHAAVKGRQDVKWLRKCWYRALGARVWVEGADTPGQINIRAPWKRWGGHGSTWGDTKLAGYLGKYIAKSFDSSEMLKARRYWPSDGLHKPEISSFYLQAVSLLEMIHEVTAIVQRTHGRDWTMWLSKDEKVFWISATGRPPETIPF